AMLMWGVPLIVLGGVPGALTALVAWAVCGAGNTVGDVAGFTLLQRAAPEHLLARAFAALDSVLFGSIALGGLLAPLVIDAFGEIALLKATPRTATVEAAQALQTFTLDRDEFLAAVTGHAASTAAADEIVAARLARARPALASL